MLERHPIAGRNCTNIQTENHQRRHTPHKTQQTSPPTLTLSTIHFLVSFKNHGSYPLKAHLLINAKIAHKKWVGFQNNFFLMELPYRYTFTKKCTLLLPQKTTKILPIFSLGKRSLLHKLIVPVSGLARPGLLRCTLVQYNIMINSD